MKNVIEFNAWWVNERAMCHVEEIDFIAETCDVQYPLNPEDEAICSGFDIPFSKVTLLQYTKKKDSYGAKLFQGDIIRARYKEGLYRDAECMPYERVVVRERYLLIKDAMNFQKPDRIGGITSSFLNKRKPIWKKMGNIYQNPELKKLL